MGLYIFFLPRFWRSSRYTGKTRPFRLLSTWGPGHQTPDESQRSFWWNLLSPRTRIICSLGDVIRWHHADVIRWRHAIRAIHRRHGSHTRDLKQARTVTAGNKQLNFTVKNKPHTTKYIYCIFEAYFMIRSVWKNCTDCFEVILE